MGLLRTADAAWLHMEQPTNPMTVTALLRFASQVSWDDVRAVVAERLVARYPKFAWRIVDPGYAPAAWQKHPDFDLDAHLPHLVLDEADPDALRRLVGDLMSTPLDLARPPWVFHCVDGVRGGRSAIVCRIHHAVADGIALARVLLDLCDDVTGVPVPPPREPKHHATRVEALRAELARMERSGVDVVRAAAHLVTLPPDPPSPLKAVLSGTKRIALAAPVPLTDVKRVGRSLGGTVNDALLTAVSGALGRYLRELGDAPDEVRALVPVYVWPMHLPVPRELGNHFSLVYLPLPIGVIDPAERLALLRERMDAIKQGKEAAVAYGLLQGMGAAPRVVEEPFAHFFGRKASLIVTNVPGPRELIHLAGTPLDAIWFWVPQASGIGLGISLFSYAGEVGVGIASDTAAVPEPRRLAAAFEDELAALISAADPRRGTGAE